MKHFLAGMAAAIVLASFLVFLMMAADLPPLNDGSDHGDPPYLTESGWKPLLNGKDLSGWELADPNKKGKWLVTSAVIWGGVNNPTSLVGVPNSPGDRIVNTDVDPAGNASNIYTTEKFGDSEVYPALPRSCC